VRTYILISLIIFLGTAFAKAQTVDGNLLTNTKYDTCACTAQVYASTYHNTAILANNLLWLQNNGTNWQQIN